MKIPEGEPIVVDTSFPSDSARLKALLRYVPRRRPDNHFLMDHRLLSEEELERLIEKEEATRA